MRLKTDELRHNETTLSCNLPAGKRSENNENRAANDKQFSKNNFQRYNFMQKHHREKNSKRDAQLVDRSDL